MDGFFVAILFAIVCACGAYEWGQNSERADLIRAKEFCVKNETNGVKFEKCYTVKEKGQADG